MVPSARLAIGAGALAVCGDGGGGAQRALGAAENGVGAGHAAPAAISRQSGLARACNRARLLSGMPGQHASRTAAAGKRRAAERDEACRLSVPDPTCFLSHHRGRGITFPHDWRLASFLFALKRLFPCLCNGAIAT